MPPRFARNLRGRERLNLDQLAKRYGCLPSDLISMPEDLLTLNFLCAAAGLAHER